MATEITTEPFANHNAVPTPTEGNSTVYTVVGSDMKWEKKSNGLNLPYIEPADVRRTRIAAEEQAKSDAAFAAQADRLGYVKK